MNTKRSSEFSDVNSFRNPKVLAEMAIFVALATALSFIIVYMLPQGGSITAASMVPILWLALRRGTKSRHNRRGFLRHDPVNNSALCN